MVDCTLCTGSGFITSASINLNAYSYHGTPKFYALYNVNRRITTALHAAAVRGLLDPSLPSENLPAVHSLKEDALVLAARSSTVGSEW
jgi:hypothetical protein